MVDLWNNPRVAEDVKPKPVEALKVHRVETQRPAGRWAEPLPIESINSEGISMTWLWEGCIAKGHLTLLSALMKAGKSTLLGHLLRAIQHGADFLERRTTEANTLIVSEESHTIWATRRDRLALDNHIHLLSKPMKTKPSYADWEDFIGYVGLCARNLGAGLVVIDTLGKFAPWRNENDAAEVTAALNPLDGLTESGLAVLAVHHCGKMGGTEGRAVRGSTALAGAADILLELKRYDSNEMSDRRRVVTGSGRFDEIPQEVVISLNPEGDDYRVEGERRQVVEASRTERLYSEIRRALPSSYPGLTTEEAHERMERPPQRSKLSKALLEGAVAGEWMMSGTGSRSDPRRYYNMAA